MPCEESAAVRHGCLEQRREGERSDPKFAVPQAALIARETDQEAMARGQESEALRLVLQGAALDLMPEVRIDVDCSLEMARSSLSA